MNYGEYDAADFAADASFRIWVLEKRPAVNRFWENWLAMHPEKEGAVIEARMIVQALQFRTNEATADEMAAIKSQIDLLLDDTAAKKNSWFLRSRWFYAAAASAALIVFIGAWYFRKPAPQTLEIVQTKFGETKIVQLPDGSVVQLNANSSLSFFKEWNKENVRTVTLSGEAYFKVSKSPAGLHPKFRVQMPEAVIEVKGTAFNVYNRHKEVRVLLEEGKIVLNDSLNMKPGEMMRIANGQHQWIHEDPVQSTAWKQHRLVYKDLPLTVIARDLNDIYGYQIKFGSKKLEGLLFTGSCSADDPMLLLSAIATVHELKMKKNDSMILFE
jgi:ferric-dicitrate binding protein FerR (iron transport regulator)